MNIPTLSNAVFTQIIDGLTFKVYEVIKDEWNLCGNHRNKNNVPLSRFFVMVENMVVGWEHAIAFGAANMAPFMGICTTKIEAIDKIKKFMNSVDKIKRLRAKNIEKPAFSSLNNRIILKEQQQCQSYFNYSPM